MNYFNFIIFFSRTNIIKQLSSNKNSKFVELWNLFQLFSHNSENNGIETWYFETYQQAFGSNIELNWTYHALLPPILYYWIFFI